MYKKPFKHNKFVFLCFIVSLIIFFSINTFAQDQPLVGGKKGAETSEHEAWTGIDVSIVGKYATKYGRPPRDPYINTDQGDLLLFVFTLAGVVGGFVMGYNARKLFFEKQS